MSIEIEGNHHIPYSPNNNLLRNGVVRFPSAVGQYQSKTELLEEIAQFIRRYCDLEPDLEFVAVYYVMFTWLYDAFNEVPYLRVRGELGSGKTRFLLVVGSLCYKATFASGASTVSPIFRMLDVFRGTLVLDEADFQASDERGLIVKLLNNGHASGFPVLRSESTRNGEYSPTAFHVFGPKLIASRRAFSDRALESRCITFDLTGRPPRNGIPLNLPTSFDEEATRMRNKLARFRFNELMRTRNTVSTTECIGVEARIGQIFAPLLAIADDHVARSRLREIAAESNRVLFAERSMSVESHLLQIMKDMIDSNEVLLLKDIARRFAAKYEHEYRTVITPRWIGRILRHSLNVVPEKTRGTFRVRAEELPRLQRLFTRYAIARVDQVTTLNVRTPV